MHGTALLQQHCCRSHERATARKSQANFPNHQTHSRCCFQWEGAHFWENSEVGHFSSENSDEQPPESNPSFPTTDQGAVAANVLSPRSRCLAVAARSRCPSQSGCSAEQCCNASGAPAFRKGHAGSARLASLTPVPGQETERITPKTSSRHTEDEKVTVTL